MYKFIQVHIPPCVAFRVEGWRVYGDVTSQIIARWARIKFHAGVGGCTVNKFIHVHRPLMGRHRPCIHGWVAGKYKR